MYIASMEKIKCCRKCGIKKTISCFYPSKDGRFGVLGRCKECVNKETNSYYLVHKEQIKKRHKDNYYLDIDKTKAKRKINSKRYTERTDKWRKIYPDKYHAASNAIQKRNRKNVDPIYIKQKLIQQGWPKEAITHDLVELKRSLIKIKRYVKKNSKTSK